MLMRGAESTAVSRHHLKALLPGTRWGLFAFRLAPIGEHQEDRFPEILAAFFQCFPFPDRRDFQAVSRITAFGSWGNHSREFVMHGEPPCSWTIYAVALRLYALFLQRT